MANELVVIEKATALDLFTTESAVDKVISTVKEKALEELAHLNNDLEVKKNRDEIASLAYKVARTKTYIDKVGKEVVDNLKALPKKVDANRKVIRDELDSLSKEIRTPLTAWEEVKKAEEAAEQLKKQIELDHEEALQMNELFDLRKAEEERQRIAHEEEIKQRAAKEAKLEAERKAQQELEAAAKREREAKEALERAEREKKEAIQRAEQAAKEAQERAEREKQLAIESERKKAQEAEQARLAQEERKRIEAEKRAANIEHKRKINNSAVADLVASGVSEECARLCITAIIKGAVSNVIINY